jgi:hypothetical protein
MLARTRRLNIRLSEGEWETISNLAKNSTCRTVSEYCRKVLVQKPVKVFYRNKSFDEFEERLSWLMPMLEKYEKNIISLMKQLAGNPAQKGSDDTVALLSNYYQQFADAVEQIRDRVEKLSDECGQK